MRAKVLIAVCALALGAAGGWFAKRVPAPVAPEPPAQVSAPKLAVAPMPRPAGSGSEIPLSELIDADWFASRDFNKNRLFLVEAPNSASATRTASKLLDLTDGEDRIWAVEPTEHDKFWAVVHFGGSLPHEIVSVVASEFELTINYRWVVKAPRPGEVRFRAFVVPLELSPRGGYSLRMFNLSTQSFTRVVYAMDLSSTDADCRSFRRRARAW